jgi:hypothetical protein
LTDGAFSAEGGTVTTGTLPEGTYAWRGRCKNYGTGGNADSLTTWQYWSTWTAWQVFTVDTSNPPTPTVSSPQFPAGMEGGAATSNGTFTFNNDHSDAVGGVKGYLFSLDNDLSSTVFGGGHFTTVSNGSAITISPGTIYWIAANTDPQGYSYLSFAPGSTGPHRVYAKAVDQAGNTSAGEGRLHRSHLRRGQPDGRRWHLHRWGRRHR